MNGLRRNVATLWYEAKEMWFPVTRGIYSLLKKINLRPITKSYTVNTYARSLLKAHVQPVCIAVVHFTEIICCNTEITNVISVFDNRIASVSFKKGITACYCLRLWRYNPIFKHSQNVRNFYIQQMISVKCTTAVHTGWRCPFKKVVPQKTGLKNPFREDLLIGCWVVEQHIHATLSIINLRKRSHRKTTTTTTTKSHLC